MVAPPTSVTMAPGPSPGLPAVSAHSTAARSTASGVAIRTSAANRGAADSRFPAITCRRNSRPISSRAGPVLVRPSSGSTLGTTVTDAAPGASSPATTRATARLQATTTWAPVSDPAIAAALSSTRCCWPSSVPPANSTISGASALSRAASAPVSRPARTASSRAPAFSAAVCAASAVSSGTRPTAAIRSPPPALDAASSRATVAGPRTWPSAAPAASS